MSTLHGPKVYDGIVREVPYEKHDRVVLVMDEADPVVQRVNGVPLTDVYPRYLLDDLVGERVRIYVVPVKAGPEPGPAERASLYTWVSGFSARFEASECCFCRKTKPCAVGATPAWQGRMLPTICADCALEVVQQATKASAMGGEP